MGMGAGPARVCRQPRHKSAGRISQGRNPIGRRRFASPASRPQRLDKRVCDFLWRSARAAGFLAFLRLHKEHVLLFSITHPFSGGQSREGREATTPPRHHHHNASSHLSLSLALSISAKALISAPERHSWHSYFSI
jgi:hypothetical protein